MTVWLCTQQPEADSIRDALTPVRPLKSFGDFPNSTSRKSCGGAISAEGAAGTPGHTGAQPLPACRSVRHREPMEPAHPNGARGARPYGRITGRSLGAPPLDIGLPRDLGQDLVQRPEDRRVPLPYR